MDVMNRQFYGMKLTNTPESYTQFPVETQESTRALYYYKTGH